MTAKSYERGHEIAFLDGEWHYLDTGKPINIYERASVAANIQRQTAMMIVWDVFRAHALHVADMELKMDTSFYKKELTLQRTMLTLALIVLFSIIPLVVGFKWIIWVILGATIGILICLGFALYFIWKG